MSEWFRWQRGRQEGSYSKFALLPKWLSHKLNFDAYILKFPVGSSVIGHRDPVDAGYEHHRVNITLKSDGFTRMYIEGPIKRWWIVEKFRPDLHYHGLNKVQTSMYMLSIGWRVKTKQVV